MSKITLRLDTSQIVQALKCPAYHNFVSVQNLAPKYANRVALDRGTVMHGLLQRYYQKIWEREVWPSAMSYSVSCLTELKMGMKLDMNDYKLILMRFSDYCVKYHKESVQVATVNIPDEKGVIRKRPALEIGFSVPILDSEEYYFVLEGRIDMVTVMSGCDVIWDHKAQGRAYNLYGHSIQMLNYALAVGTNMTMYNFVRLHQAIQNNTFDRKLKYIPMWLQERWRAKLIATFTAISKFRSRNESTDDIIDSCFPNQSCNDIGFGKICPFVSVCEEQIPSVREAVIQANYEERKQWQPWSLEESFTEGEIINESN